MKDCGSCALCCKLLDVPGLAGPGTQCPHCNPGCAAGCCTIHENRPQVCLGFDCFWKAESWPDWLRPDRCGVIFEALPGVETVLASIEPSTPNAWRKPEIRRVIEILRGKGRPIVLKSLQGPVIFLPKDGMNCEYG